jgi:copper chaperone
MLTLSVPDMTCGHCRASVEAAIARLDPAAAVAVDLTARRVTVATQVPAAAVVAALDRAGYSAAPV